MQRLSLPLLLCCVLCLGCGGEDEWAAKRPKIYRAGVW